MSFSYANHIKFGVRGEAPTRGAGAARAPAALRPEQAAPGQALVFILSREPYLQALPVALRPEQAAPGQALPVALRPEQAAPGQALPVALRPEQNKRPASVASLVTIARMRVYPWASTTS